MGNVVFTQRSLRCCCCALYCVECGEGEFVCKDIIVGMMWVYGENEKMQTAENRDIFIRNHAKKQHSVLVYIVY